MTTTRPDTHNTDIVIIGAGPTGLFAVFQCGMLGMRCHVIDALDSVGGQCAALYPEKPIYDIPAYPKITGQELIDQLTAQAAPFEPYYHFNQQVNGLTEIDGGWQVTTSHGTVIDCKAVFIAAGGGAFGPNRPPLADLESYEGTSVFYAVKRRDNFAGKHVVIAGGGDSAVDWAVDLSDVAASITVVHRRDKFRAAPDSVRKMQDLIQTGKIKLAVPTQLHRLEGDKGQLKNVIVIDDQNVETSLPADILLPFYGLASTLGPLEQFGLEQNKHVFTVNPATQQTNLPAVYAIGDVAGYTGKLKLILQGFSEAAVAAHDAYKYVFPGQYLEISHSTDKGIKPLAS